MSLVEPPDMLGVGWPLRPGTAGTGLPKPGFSHLRHLTDARGVFEHARYTTPRIEHGYCTDDNARALIVACRQGELGPPVPDLASKYLRFVLDARTDEGGFHNRRRADGAWLDEVGSDDAQGRAWWALGIAARAAPEPWMRDVAAAAFQGCSSFTSPHLRSNAFATLGAAERLRSQPDQPAITLLRRTASVIATRVRAGSPWPEGRLTYDNARLPEALLAAGEAFADRELLDLGLGLLTWLVDVETGTGDHFSFTPAGGWTPGEPRPGFDQQPLEAAAMADACARAWAITADPRWRDRTLCAARWFLGHNDTGSVLYDAATGGCGDGLEEQGMNQNQGAESTLSALTALQAAASS